MSPAGDWPYLLGKALPIAKVRVEIQGQVLEQEATETDACVSLILRLKQGKAQLTTAFLYKDGQVISGIYYVDVTLKF